MAYPAPEILRDEAPARTVQPEAAPAAEAAAPPPVVPIILNSQNSADRMKEITDRLETGIQELFESERYKAYLTTIYYSGKDDSGSQIVCGLFNLPNNIFLNHRA